MSEDKQTETTEEKARSRNSAGTHCYMNFHDFKLVPETPTVEEAEQLATPEGMRHRIEMYSRYDPLTRKCFDIARMNKCDDLDTMTVIALQALSENQRLKYQLLKQAHESPAPMLFSNI